MVRWVPWESVRRQGPVEGVAQVSPPPELVRSVRKLGARFRMRLTVAKDEIEDGHVERRVNALQIEQNCG